MDDFIVLIIVIAVVVFAFENCGDTDPDITCTTNNVYSVVIDDPETKETVRVNTDRQCSKLKEESGQSNSDQSLAEQKPAKQIKPNKVKKKPEKKDPFPESW